MHEKQRNVLLISHQINGFVLNLLETDGLVAPHFHRNRETLRRKALFAQNPKSLQEKKKTRTRRIRTHRSFFFRTTKSAGKPNLSSPILFRFPPPPSRVIYSHGGSQRTRGLPSLWDSPTCASQGFFSPSGKFLSGSPWNLSR